MVSGTLSFVPCSYNTILIKYRTRFLSPRSTKRLFPLLPTRRYLCFWSGWAISRHKSATFCPILSFLRRCSIRDQDLLARAYQLVEWSRGSDTVLGRFLEGGCGHFPLYMERAKEMSNGRVGVELGIEG